MIIATPGRKLVDILRAQIGRGAPNLVAPADRAIAAIEATGHVPADLPRELQKDALKKGMKIYSSSFPVDWMTVYLGGQYYLPGDPAFKPDVPWTKKAVRQALNMAVNRKELLNTVFAGKGTMTYVTGW